MVVISFCDRFTGLNTSFKILRFYFSPLPVYTAITLPHFGCFTYNVAVIVAVVIVVITTTTTTTKVNNNMNKDNDNTSSNNSNIDE